jgi:hypothetical protein
VPQVTDRNNDTGNGSGDTGTGGGTGTGTGGTGVGTGNSGTGNSGTGSSGIGTDNSGTGTDSGSGNSSGNNSPAITLTTAPILTVSPIHASEDQPVPLTIRLSAQTDTSITTVVTISGIPDGGTLSAGTQNSDGTWTLTPAQLAGLTLTLPTHDTGTIALDVSAASSQSSTTLSSDADLSITVDPVAHTPTLSVSPVVGWEDAPIALNIAAATTDNFPSEALSVTITGIPTGATLSAGTQNSDGSWTLTSAQLSGLTLTPPTHWSGNLDFTVTATTSIDGSNATATADLPVTVTSIAFTPSLNVTATTGLENAAIPLHIDASLVEFDSSGALSLTIGGMPDGATLSAGTHNSDGTWTLTPDQLTGLTLTPPANYTGTLQTTITATSTENGTTASAEADLPITVESIAVPPTITVQAATGNEDTAIALNISASLAAGDSDGTLAVTVSGLPTGATLSAGTHNGDGTWTLTPDQLSGLTLTPPTNYTGSLTLVLTASSTENGTTASTIAALPVTVQEVAKPPTLTISAASGLENAPISLNIGATLNGTDGSQTLSVNITGVPDGATLSAGTHNSDGSWTLTAAQLTGLTLTPPTDMSGNINLTVMATSSEHGTTASASGALAVTVAPIAMPPVLTVQAATGTEDAPISLQIGASLSPADAGEGLSVTITGVPTGATLSAGTRNSDGSWTLTSAQLSGLTLTPPTHFNGSLSLGVTATASENGTTATTATTLPVTVDPIALTPSLSVQAAAGVEDTPVALCSATKIAPSHYRLAPHFRLPILTKV